MGDAGIYNRTCLLIGTGCFVLAVAIPVVYWLLTRGAG